MRRISPLERLRLFGRAGIDVVATLGRSVLFLLGALFGRSRAGKPLQLLIKQLFAVGVMSLAIIVVSGIFIGMVLALQGYNILVSYGSEQAVGQMVALTLLRELGPVVTALLFAGRAGSALTAEIGNMKSTEQLSSLEMIGVDPLKYIVAPRLWAGFISMPLKMPETTMIARDITPTANSCLISNCSGLPARLRPNTAPTRNSTERPRVATTSIPARPNRRSRSSGEILRINLSPTDLRGSPVPDNGMAPDHPGYLS